MSVVVVRDDQVIEAIVGGNTTAATGSNPPEPKVRVRGDVPMKSEMSVTVVRPGVDGPPRRAPKARTWGQGWCPRGRSWDSGR